jgi:hypothetical protein
MDTDDALDVVPEHNESKDYSITYTPTEKDLWPGVVLPLLKPLELDPCEENYWLLGPMRYYKKRID